MHLHKIIYSVEICYTINQSNASLYMHTILYATSPLQFTGLGNKH